MVKRIFDVAIALTSLIVFAPLAALIAILIKLETPGPVLTSRVCVGRHGKHFTLYHFRTMTVATQDTPAMRTPWGRVLCNYSLNDYPTFWSVFKGDISIIGPRPHRPEEIDWEHADWRRILSVKPGLIGPALLALRECYNQTDMATRTAIEMHYVAHHTFGDDIRLFVRGVRALHQMGHIKGKVV